jgi:hypothetical protein
MILRKRTFEDKWLKAKIQRLCNTCQHIRTLDIYELMWGYNITLQLKIV